MNRIFRRVMLILVAVTLFPAAVYACGVEISFRSYLDKRFWQPFAKYEAALGLTVCREAVEARTLTFAGMADSGPAALQAVRNAYKNSDYNALDGLSAAALSRNPSNRDREEIQLIAAKTDMRRGEKTEPQRLALTADTLSKFLNEVQTPELRSEARGWLARVHYLMGNYSAAAKIYLDEFDKEDTIFTRESLINSLRTLFPYNGSNSRLADHIEEYFDTPRHALFAVVIATNPIYNDDGERALMAETAKKILDVLQRRSALFLAGEESEALALALMRTALYMGDPASAVEYAKNIPLKSKIADAADYNWMLASAHFILRNYTAAEVPLLNMLRSPITTTREKNTAAQGLIGVYQKTGRKEDQLYAAFMARKYEAVRDAVSLTSLAYWPAAESVYDLPYLLDVQLTDDDLAKFLEKYSRQVRALTIDIWAKSKRTRSAYEIVQYTRAVRLARNEKFREAEKIFRGINALPRAERMLKLASLHSAAADKHLTGRKHLEALYVYGAFLEEHSTQVFFNDMFWNGLQTMTFITRNNWSGKEENSHGLTGRERKQFLELEQNLRDAQEERWRAYTILIDVAEQAGTSDLGKKAGEKALKALRLINTTRFGKEEEINRAITLLERAIASGEPLRK